MNDSILLARQPIFDRKNTMVACEILYRGSALNSERVDKNSVATSELLSNTCTSLMNENVNLGLPMLINIDEQFLLSDDFFPVVPHNLIFEILETVEPNEKVLTKLRQLKKQGFEFALDDYLLEKFKQPFFQYLKIIKVDVIDVDFRLLEKTFSFLKNVGCLLLAEKIEDQEMFENCKKLGFDLFQGFYLEKPTLIQGKKIEVSKIAALNIISQLSRPDIEVDEVAELISRSPALSVKILALINCPLYQLVRTVNTIKDAVIILGLVTIKQWVMILTLVSELEQPIELMRTILIRAKTLALYSKLSGDNVSDAKSAEYFLVGLLSGIDAIFETEIEIIIEHLNISHSIKSALLGQENEMGKILKNSIGLERFDGQIFEQLSTHEICLLNRCYREALAWADEAMNLI